MPERDYSLDYVNAGVTPQPKPVPAPQPRPVVPQAAIDIADKEKNPHVRAQMYQQIQRFAEQEIARRARAQLDADHYTRSRADHVADVNLQTAEEIKRDKAKHALDLERDAANRAAELKRDAENKKAIAIEKKREDAEKARLEQQKAHAALVKQRVVDSGKGNRLEQSLEAKDRWQTDANDYKYASLAQQKKIADQKASLFEWAKKNGWTQDQYEAQLKFIDHEYNRTLKGGPLVGGPQIPVAPGFVAPSEDQQDGGDTAPPRENLHAQQGYDSLLQRAHSAKIRQIQDIADTQSDPNITPEAKAKLLPQMKAELERTNASIIQLQQESAVHALPFGESTRQAQQATYGQRVKPEAQETQEQWNRRYEAAAKHLRKKVIDPASDLPTEQDASHEDIMKYLENQDAGYQQVREKKRKAAEQTQAVRQHDQYWENRQAQQADAEKQVQEGLQDADYKAQLAKDLTPKVEVPSPVPDEYGNVDGAPDPIGEAYGLNALPTNQSLEAQPQPKGGIFDTLTPAQPNNLQPLNQPQPKPAQQMPANPYIEAPKVQPAPKPVIESGTQRDMAMTPAATPAPQVQVAKPKTFISKSGKRYTMADVEETANTYGISTDEVIKHIMATGIANTEE